MSFSEVISRKTFLKISFLFAWRSMTKIAGSGSINHRNGSGSVPNFHVSATLLQTAEFHKFGMPPTFYYSGQQGNNCLEALNFWMPQIDWSVLSCSLWSGGAVDSQEDEDGNNVHPVLGQKGPIVRRLSWLLSRLLLKYLNIIIFPHIFILCDSLRVQFYKEALRTSLSIIIHKYRQRLSVRTTEPMQLNKENSHNQLIISPLPPPPQHTGVRI